MAYLVFSLFPADYRQALNLDLVLEVSAFVGAVLLILRSARRPFAYCFLAAVLLVSFYKPLDGDLRVANFNCLLLLGLALAFRTSERLTKRMQSAAPRENEIVALGAVSLVLVGCLALVKPSLLTTTATIGLFLFARLGRRRGSSAILLAGVVLAGAACAPMIYFGSPAIWIDWVRYFANSNVNMFGLPLEAGNMSVPLFLSHRTGLPFGIVAALLFSLVVLTLILTAMRHGRPLERLRAAMAQPWTAISLGVTTFFAISPLAWVHYHILLLAPSLLLLERANRGRPEAYVAFLGVFLAAGAPAHLQALIGAGYALSLAVYGLMLSWPALWFATLLIINSQAHCTEGSAPPVATKGP
jgi:hypothetical protein